MLASPKSLQFGIWARNPSTLAFNTKSRNTRRLSDFAAVVGIWPIQIVIPSRIVSLSSPRQYSIAALCCFLLSGSCYEVLIQAALADQNGATSTPPRPIKLTMIGLHNSSLDLGPPGLPTVDCLARNRVPRPQMLSSCRFDQGQERPHLEFVLPPHCLAATEDKRLGMRRATQLTAHGPGLVSNCNSTVSCAANQAQPFYQRPTRP